jgi:tRNA uridine 5-carboxymethylaminomethyl modification enzyme
MASGEIPDSTSLEELAKRPGVTVEMIRRLMPSTVNVNDLESALADSLYAGYIRSQLAVTQRIDHHDGIRIPADLDFRALKGLSHEMVERLERARPMTLGEARNIPGLTAAAISTLYVATSVSG